MIMWYFFWFAPLECKRNGHRANGNVAILQEGKQQTL